MFEPPQIGHMLYDHYDQLGMVIECEYIADETLYLICVEWYFGDRTHKEYYRVGPFKSNDDIHFLRTSYYREMRERYALLRSKDK